MQEHTIWLSAAGGALVAWLILRVRRALDAWRLRRRFARGRSGHKKARRTLKSHGFEVLGEEVPIPGAVEVDGQRRGYELRIDFVVGKGRRTYGVEVKTGARAPDPMHRDTRRQLLEYSAHLGLDGLYLLDMEEGRLMRVRFPALQRRRGGGWILPMLLGAALGVALALAMLDL